MVEIILTLLKARRIQIDPNVVNFDRMLSRGRSGDEIKKNVINRKQIHEKVSLKHVLVLHVNFFKVFEL